MMKTVLAIVTMAVSSPLPPSVPRTGQVEAERVPGRTFGAGINLEPHMNSWDCLAGMLLVEEAGGFSNDFLAKNGLIDGNKVIAGPKPLRSELERLTAHWG